MSRIRRLYFYLVSYASLAMLLSGLAVLSDVALKQLFGIGDSPARSFREQTAVGIALVGVGLPVWLLHWRAIESWLRPDRTGAGDERASGLRRLYLYAVLAPLALVAFSASTQLVRLLLGLPFGLRTTPRLLQELSQALPPLLLSLPAWVYHARLAQRDRALVRETGASATLRRWYVYGLAAVGVVLLMFSLSEFGRELWLRLVSPGGSALEVAIISELAVDRAATILTALVLWLLHLAWAERAAAVPTWYGENERRSVLRKVYLYALVTLTVAWTLTNAQGVLRYLLETALGIASTQVGGEPVLVAMGRPLASIVVFGVFWAYHWAALRREAAAEPEVGRQAGVRRLYLYLVALVALAAASYALASLLHLLADLLLQPPIVDPNAPRRQLAEQLGLLLVALPLWLAHWRTAQQARLGPAGPDEIRATTRRLFLYLVALAAVGVLLFNGARVVYEVVMAILGQPLGGRELAELSHHLINVGLGVLQLWYHWWLVLRGDLADLRGQEATRSRARLLVAGLDREAAEQLERYVRQTIPDARVKIEWEGNGEVRSPLPDDRVRATP